MGEFETIRTPQLQHDIRVLAGVAKLTREGAVTFDLVLPILLEMRHLPAPAPLAYWFTGQHFD